MEYIETEQNLRVVTEYDIIVVGSGSSGIGAAVAAGRNGGKILLIESQGSVGGISTPGLMSHFTGNVDSALYWEILERQTQKNYFKGGNVIEIDPELLKNVYFKLLEEVGVTILLYTLVCGTIMEENHLQGGNLSE